MPQLIKSVTFNIFGSVEGDVSYQKALFGDVQQEDYINMNGFVAFLQNFTQVETATKLNTPIPFGLQNINHIPVVTLNISY